MASSSASSRISAVSGVSPASTFPPGNSHNPAIGLPAGRRASNTRPSASSNAAAATSTMRLRAIFRAIGSAPVAGIDVDVSVGQIAGPYRRLAAADTDIDRDLDVAAAHMCADGRLVIAGDRAAARGDLDPADRNRQAFGIDLFPGPADGHDDAAPIGVPSRQRGLDQGR